MLPARPLSTTQWHRQALCGLWDTVCPQSWGPRPEELAWPSVKVCGTKSTFWKIHQTLPPPRKGRGETTSPRKGLGVERGRCNKAPLCLSGARGDCPYHGDTPQTPSNQSLLPLRPVRPAAQSPPLRVTHTPPPRVCFWGARVRHTAHGHRLPHFCPMIICAAAGGAASVLRPLTQSTGCSARPQRPPTSRGEQDGRRRSESGSPRSSGHGAVPAVDTPASVKGEACLCIRE